MPQSVPSGAATSAKFDTTQFNKSGDDGSGSIKEHDLKEIAAYKRGMAWLQRELYGLEVFCRAVTGNDSLRLRVGVIPCTDGDTIYLKPPKIYDDDPEPGVQVMSYLWHEVAHVIDSQVYEPASSRKLEDAIKVKGNKLYGAPSDFMWNALEDGRVEIHLYVEAPGAEKHIVKNAHEQTPLIIANAEQIGRRFGDEHMIDTADQAQINAIQVEAHEHMLRLNPEYAKRYQRGTSIDELQWEANDELKPFQERMLEVARKTGDAVGGDRIAKNIEHDIGILMTCYLETAGYKHLADEFPKPVTDALRDPEVQKWIEYTHKLEKSWPVMTESTQYIMKRLRELGFFVDWDQRALDPTSGQQQTIDWNDLTDEEKEAIRAAIKQQKIGQDPQGSLYIKNAPKDLFDNQPKSGHNPHESGNEASEEEQEAQGGKSAGPVSDPSGSDNSSDAESQSTSGSSGSGDDSAVRSDSDPDSDSASDVSTGDGDSGSLGSDGDSGDHRAGSGDESDELGDEEAEDPSSEDLGGSESEQSLGAAGNGDRSLEAEDQVESEAESDEWTEEDEEAAKALHKKREEQRVKRTKSFQEAYGEIEDKIRPPHVEYVTKKEADRLLPNDKEAQKIKSAQDLELGAISGAPEHRFLFKERRPYVSTEDIRKAPTLDEYNEVLAGEANRLRAVFKKNEKYNFYGQYEIGTHINDRALPGFIVGEHLKPFNRRTVPKKLSYAVQLVIDMSGSMVYHQKIETARTALAMQASLLDKLRIPCEILGFSTKAIGAYDYLSYDGYKQMVLHDVFKEFDSAWTPEQRAKVMSIGTNYCNLDGLALAWAWSRLSRRPEQVKIMMVYSDGQPNPDTDRQIKIMKYVLAQMDAARAIAIGIGIQSDSVTDLYKTSVKCDQLATLPRLVTGMLETQLKAKR